MHLAGRGATGANQVVGGFENAAIESDVRQSGQTGDPVNDLESARADRGGAGVGVVALQGHGIGVDLRQSHRGGDGGANRPVVRPTYLGAPREVQCAPANDVVVPRVKFHGVGADRARDIHDARRITVGGAGEDGIVAVDPRAIGRNAVPPIRERGIPYSRDDAVLAIESVAIGVPDLGRGSGGKGGEGDECGDRSDEDAGGFAGVLLQGI